MAFSCPKRFAFLVNTVLLICLFLYLDNPTQTTAKSPNRIACFIFTCPQNLERAFAINDTWGKRCDGAFFVMEYYVNLTHQLNFLPLKGIIPGYSHLWSKTVLTFTYVFENYLNEFEWFFKVDDDAYVVLENLRYFLSHYNSAKPLYFGKRFRVLSDYMAGGPGYVLSREAVRRVRHAFSWSNKSCPGLQTAYFEDVLMGQCLHEVGVRCANTLDVTGKETFHDHEMRTQIVGKPPEWIYKYSYYPVQKGYNCCSDYTISFHYVKPSDMKLMDFLLYHLKVKGEQEETSSDIFRYWPANEKEYEKPKDHRDPS